MFIASLLLLSSLGYSNAAAVLAKRAEDEDPAAMFLAIPLEEGDEFYSIPLHIGNSTNSTIFLKLDTTSNTIWVNSDSNEFCQATYPFHPIGNESTWNSFNDELRWDYLDNVASFQSAQKSQLETLLSPSKTIDYHSAVTLFEDRQSSFSNYIGNQKSSLTSEAMGFASVHSAKWESFTVKQGSVAKSAQSEASKIGNAIATKAESFGAEVTSWGGALLTRVTDSPVTSVGESLASDVTSGFGDFTGGAASRFGDLTSGLANFFKRAEEPTVTSTITPSTSFPSISTTFKFAPSATALDKILPSNLTESFIADLYFELEDCSIYGTFNGSDTFVSNETIYISEDGEVLGLLGNDTFYLPSGPVDNVTFVVAEISDSNIGSFGLGQKTENSTFTPFPEFLVESGVIGKALYSLDLSDSDPSLLFGAINYDAFSENLTLVPLLNETEAIAITLSSFGLSYANEKENSIYDIVVAEGAAFATLDSTSNNVYLPFDVLEALVLTLNNSYPIDYDEVYGRFVLSVPSAKEELKAMKNTSSPIDLEDFNVALHFQGLAIDIPLMDFLIPIAENETEYFNLTTSTHDGTNESFYFIFDDDLKNSTEYILSILPSESEEVILGLPFLTEVYVVVDLELGVVGLAPLDKETTEDEDKLNIITISDEIPLAVNATYFDEYYGSSSNLTSLAV